MVVTVATPAPVVTLAALPTTVITGQATGLSWTATDATGCVASGSWTGARNATGSESTGPIAATATYRLSCSGPGGTTQASLEVAAFPPPSPPVAVQAAYGDGGATVLWQSAAGSFYAGFPVTSNIYVSTNPSININAFVESPTSQVRRGLARMQQVAFSGFTNGVPLYIIATDVANGAESGPSTRISVTPHPVPALVEHIAQLNDTGVVGCTDLTVLDLPCPVGSVPGQDADIGRDADARNGRLTKTGLGAAGFDFTKRAPDGATLPAGAGEWPCLTDNVTGLTWIVPGGSANAVNTDTYSWYEPNADLHGGNPGERNAGACSAGDCDTFSYMGLLNIAGQCGYRNWRLPTRRELATLVDYGRWRPAFDTTVFPRMPDYGFAFFWTSTVGAPGIGTTVWVADVSTGAMYLRPKFEPSPFQPRGAVLAVRSDGTP